MAELRYTQNTQLENREPSPAEACGPQTRLAPWTSELTSHRERKRTNVNSALTLPRDRAPRYIQVVRYSPSPRLVPASPGLLDPVWANWVKGR